MVLTKRAAWFTLSIMKKWIRSHVGRLWAILTFFFFRRNMHTRKKPKPSIEMNTLILNVEFIWWLNYITTPNRLNWIIKNPISPLRRTKLISSVATKHFFKPFFFNLIYKEIPSFSKEINMHVEIGGLFLSIWPQ